MHRGPPTKAAAREINMVNGIRWSRTEADMKNPCERCEVNDRSKPVSRADQPATTIATTETASKQLMAREEPRCRERRPAMTLDPDGVRERRRGDGENRAPSISEE
jgi:hypothetical protein